MKFKILLISVVLCGCEIGETNERENARSQVIVPIDPPFEAQPGCRFSCNLGTGKCVNMDCDSDSTDASYDDNNTCTGNYI